jgi:hypothetical protein
LIAVTLLALAAPAAAKDVKVFVFVAPEGPEGFQTVPRTLADSAEDLRHAISGSPFNGLSLTKKREDAGLVVQVTRREEVGNEMRVHVHVTPRDGVEVDLTGVSIHRWTESANEIAGQLRIWARAHPAK